MRLHAIAVLLTGLLLLAGCANQPEQSTVPLDWRDRSVQLQALRHWKASGKVALRNATQAESASMVWAQSGDDTKLSLSGPMGLSATTVVSDGKYLEITKAGSTRRYDISTPEAIIEQTGWNLPLQALPHWLKGVPSPLQEPDTLELEAGRLKHLKQHGWTVRYDSYGTFGPYILPTKLQIERADTRARLIIREWTIDSQK
ncbi:MAG: lipoprotein insertase outer membrane protein LolB [Halioglobus sp.]